MLQVRALNLPTIVVSPGSPPRNSYEAPQSFAKEGYDWEQISSSNQSSQMIKLQGTMCEGELTDVRAISFLRLNGGKDWLCSFLYDDGLAWLYALNVRFVPKLLKRYGL